MAGKLDRLQRVEVDDRAAWRAWLRRNHKRSEGIWLVRWKKARPDKYMGYDAIAEEALCFGWIDATARPLDHERSLILVCPRKPKSVWSKVNKQRVERLIAARRMAAAGLKAIETAQANGAWSALDEAEALVMPADLAGALAQEPNARKHFDAFPPSARKYALMWIGSAKTEATRSRRITEVAGRAARNIRPNAS
ncbi:MAG: YdeI/OmpD-associated family protein [Flavobacteriales bacterium]|jgi:uncharacterized protein YdeI (YjbR/CyaY-like superfamily)|nr:YdeI/OmpD-associated family protein [Flavobacteriales bacterium]